MDTATSDIRAVEFTPSSDGDSPILPELLEQIPESEEIGTVTADGAYDTRRCHTAILDRQATPIPPIRKNGRPWKANCPAAIARNETLRATRPYGRAFWKRWTGYHARSRIEAKMPSPVRLNRWRFSGSISKLSENALLQETQTAKLPKSTSASFAGSLERMAFACSLMNRFSALGTAEIVRVA